MVESTEHPCGTLAPALVTPFHTDGTLDIDTAARLARRMVDQGCDMILLSGTTGESPTTHQEEKNDLTDAVVDAVGKQVPVWCGAGSNDTAHAVRMAENAAEHGASGLLVVTPYYNRPSQAGVIAHVRAIEQATDLPIILYDIPGRTGLALADDTINQLAQDERVVAVKDATGNVNQGLARHRRTGLAYYSGDDALNFAWMTGGAAGCISVVAHAAASHYRRLVDAVFGENLVEARSITEFLEPLVDAIMGTGQGAVMAKWALHLQGFLPHPTVRLPLVEPTEQQISHLRHTLNDVGLL